MKMSTDPPFTILKISFAGPIYFPNLMDSLSTDHRIKTALEKSYAVRMIISLPDLRYVLNNAI